MITVGIGDGVGVVGGVIAGAVIVKGGGCDNKKIRCWCFIFYLYPYSIIDMLFLSQHTCQLDYYPWWYKHSSTCTLPYDYYYKLYVLQINTLNRDALQLLFRT